MISTTKNINEANLVTHGGVFHADDVMATIILEKFFGNVIVCRTLEVPKTLNSDVVVYDIGGGKWDHHQKGGNGARDNGIPYAASGLIWKDFGLKILCQYSDHQYVQEEIWTSIDRMLIQGIDSVDTGFASFSLQVPIMTINQIISNYNPTWDENESFDDAFVKACNVAREVFDNSVRKVISGINAKSSIKEAIKNSKNHYMILPKYVSWQRNLYFSTEPKAIDVWFVIYPSLRGGYNWQIVTTDLKNHIPMKSVPKNWYGLKGADLQKITGVKTATFCHDCGFVGGAMTLDDTIKLVELAISAS